MHDASRKVAGRWVGIGFAVALLPCGCRREVPERTYYAQAGFATDINLDDDNTVAMDWLNTKTGEVTSLRGRLTPDTEVFINGVSASVHDVRVGDRVEVVVYAEPDVDSGYVVTRVAVEREESYLLDDDRSGG